MQYYAIHKQYLVVWLAVKFRPPTTYYTRKSFRRQSGYQVATGDCDDLTLFKRPHSEHRYLRIIHVAIP